MRIDLKDGWGIDKKLVLQQLEAVADTLLPHFSKTLDTLEVRPGGMNLTDPSGQWVELGTRGPQWINYTTGFAHELCHVLTQNGRLTKTPYYSYLVDEIICEVAELITLQRMAADWKKSPPRLDRQYDSSDVTNIEYAFEKRWTKRGKVSGKIRPLNNPYGQAEGERTNGQCDRIQIWPIAPKIADVLLLDPTQWRCTECLPDCCADVRDFLIDWHKNWTEAEPMAPHSLIDALEKELVPKT